MAFSRPFSALVSEETEVVLVKLPDLFLAVHMGESYIM